MNERKLIAALLSQEFRKGHAMEKKKEVGRGRCKRNTTNQCPHKCVLQLSSENRHEALLSDCRVSVKENDSFKLNALAAHTATYFLIQLCLGMYECDHE